MRKLAIVLVPLLIMALVMGVVGCGDTCPICGLYVKQDDPMQYWEFRSDGTCNCGFIPGRWYADGNEITITWALGTSWGTVEGNKFIDASGDVWVKKGS